jgi:hypothetical protein
VSGPRVSFLLIKTIVNDNNLIKDLRLSQPRNQKLIKATKMIQAHQVNPQYYYPEDFKSSADKFFSEYKVEKEISCPLVKKGGLKDKKNRICRFCGKKYPIVSFSNDAHIFSELLGNRFLISDFECDDCNAKFGRYENDFSNFLGAIRTIQSVKGKKVPKFKSADKKFEADSLEDEKKGTVVKLKRFGTDNEIFIVDEKNGKTTVTFEKAPYTPLKVYKAILKMALSIIDDKYLYDYKFAFEFLRTNKYDNSYGGFAMVRSYTMPLTFQFQQPSGILFKKMNAADKLITHIFYFSALNFIYQIVMPFCRMDAYFYNHGTIDVPWCPPLFGHNNEEQIKAIIPFTYDLNSTERLYNQKDGFILPSPPAKSEKINNNSAETISKSFDNKKIIGIELQRIESK